MKRIVGVAFLVMVTARVSEAATCESLASLSLPSTTVTVARSSFWMRATLISHRTSAAHTPTLRVPAVCRLQGKGRCERRRQLRVPSGVEMTLPAVTVQAAAPR